MTNDLLNNIQLKLLKENWSVLPIGLKEGKIGIMLFFSLYSEFSNNNNARIISSNILLDIMSSIGKLSCSLLSGNLGLSWSIRLLIQKSILKRNKSLDKYLQFVFNDYIYCYYKMPIQVVREDNLFSGGIFMLQNRVLDSSLARYIIDENIIYLIEECDRQLNKSIKYIYEPKRMSLSTLHSILFFLLQISKYKIYPYKAERLIDDVKKQFLKIKNKPLHDHYVYDILMEKTNNILPENLDDLNLFTFMGELGFYSLLYKNPLIFQSAFKQLDYEHPNFINKIHFFINNTSASVTTLCGWGYGLLQSKVVDNE